MTARSHMVVPMLAHRILPSVFVCVILRRMKTGKEKKKRVDVLL